MSTFDRSDRLPALFAALAAQTVPPYSFEVVITDNGSRDDTPQVLERLAADAPFDTRILRIATNRGASHGRNAAWRAAQGDRILFTDDDCLPSPVWIETHLAAAQHADVIVGGTGPAPGEEPDGPFARVLRVKNAGYFSTCNVSYRRVDLDAVGGFDERFRSAGEDTDLGLRVQERGATVAFNEDAWVIHPIRPSSLRAALGQSSRWMDIVLIYRKHPAERHKRLHRGLFWRASHPRTILVLLGITVSLTTARRRPVAAATATVLSTLPWVRSRSGIPTSALPGTFLIDVVEVATMVRGSLRHRTLVL